MGPNPDDKSKSSNHFNPTDLKFLTLKESKLASNHLNSRSITICFSGRVSVQSCNSQHYNLHIISIWKGRRTCTLHAHYIHLYLRSSARKTRYIWKQSVFTSNKTLFHTFSFSMDFENTLSSTIKYIPYDFAFVYWNL